MSDKEQELANCPYCGGEAEYQWQEAGTCSPNQVDLVDIYCLDSDCGAYIRITGKEPDEAIKAWNNRHNTQELEQVRQELEDLLDELEDINCLGSLAKLLREHGRG